MYSITFFDGTFRHVRDEQAKATAEDKLTGRKDIMVDGSLIALSSISRIDPSVTWLADQREKYLLADFRICDYGHRHARGEKCRCIDRLCIPLTKQAAADCLVALSRGLRDNTLTSE